jgi:hypothetical protein
MLCLLRVLVVGTIDARIVGIVTILHVMCMMLHALTRVVARECMCHLRPDLCPHPLSENTYYEVRGITQPCVFCFEEQAQEDGFCSDVCRKMAAELDAFSSEMAALTEEEEARMIEEARDYDLAAYYALGMDYDDE